MEENNAFPDSCIFEFVLLLTFWIILYNIAESLHYNSPCRYPFPKLDSYWTWKFSFYNAYHTDSLYFYCNAPVQVNVSCKSLQPTSSYDVGFAIICTEVIEQLTFMFLSSCQRTHIKQLTVLWQQLTRMRALFILLLLKGVGLLTAVFPPTALKGRANQGQVLLGPGIKDDHSHKLCFEYFVDDKLVIFRSLYIQGVL